MFYSFGFFLLGNKVINHGDNHNILYVNLFKPTQPVDGIVDFAGSRLSSAQSYLLSPATYPVGDS